METYYEAKETEKSNLYVLTQRAGDARLPEINVVDLRQELARLSALCERN